MLYLLISVQSCGLGWLKGVGLIKMGLRHAESGILRARILRITLTRSFEMGAHESVANVWLTRLSTNLWTSACIGMRVQP